MATPEFRIAAPRGPWTEQHHYESPIVQGKRFMRALFLNCRFTHVRNTTFEHCSLMMSEFAPERLEDLLGVTMSLDCFTFGGLRLNELSLDAMLYLLSTTKGNDQKREVLRRMISEKNLKGFDEAFKRLETLGI